MSLTYAESPVLSVTTLRLWKTAASIRICGGMLALMPNLRISEAAALLGVSDDTVRRWVEQGRLDAVQEQGRMAIKGRKLAAFAQQLAESPEPGNTTAASARNRLRGIVTRVQK